MAGEPIDELVTALLRDVPRGRTAVLAVDGRGGSGKSTLTAALQAATGAAVVHTDDVAWEHSFFGWHDAIALNVLEPVRAGRAVRWTPEAWTRHGRDGVIEVEAGVPVLLVEGTGSGARRLAPLVDALVWVQTDAEESGRRGTARDVEQGRTPEDARRFWDEWMAEEEPFLSAERPWARADAVVRGDAAPPEGTVLTGA